MRADRRDAEFSEYVAQRRGHLYRTAYLLCRDPHFAEDIVQNALTKLYLAWPRVSAMKSVDAYVRRIVVNAHLDEVRRPWHRERPMASQEDQVAPAGLGPEESQALWRALGELPEKQRRVVVLRHFWGLSVEETAADLGVTTGTVKSQSSAALHRLRQVMEGGEPDD